MTVYLKVPYLVSNLKKIQMEKIAYRGEVTL